MTGELDPVVKRIDLAISPARAFAHFTQKMGSWWPLATHSLAGEDARDVIFETKVGGRIYEIDGTGNEREWGTVQECEQDRLLVFSWVLEKPDLATEVEVRFAQLGQTGCTMTLVHRGWDQRPDGAEWRANYNGGWDGVLNLYVQSIGSP